MSAKIWTDHLETPKEKAEFLTLLKTSLVARRLSDILVQYTDEIHRQEENDKFDSPAWAQLAAARIGERRAYAKILKLLTERT